MLVRKLYFQMWKRQYFCFHFDCYTTPTLHFSGSYTKSQQLPSDGAMKRAATPDWLPYQMPGLPQLSLQHNRDCPQGSGRMRTRGHLYNCLCFSCCCNCLNSWKHSLCSFILFADSISNQHTAIGRRRKSTADRPMGTPNPLQTHHLQCYLEEQPSLQLQSFDRKCILSCQEKTDKCLLCRLMR